MSDQPASAHPDHDPPRVGVVICAYNEAARLPGLIERIPRDLVSLVLVVDDGSSDGTAEAARGAGATVLQRPQRGGPGRSIRDGLERLRAEGIDIAVPLAANGKTDPGQIPDLVRPLVEEDLDLVRGSRHCPGGSHRNIPWHRLVLIRLFTLLFVLMTGARLTDATGGYQAYWLRFLDDPRIQLRQPWLGRYEVETYILTKMVMLGYRWKEVPVSITYPPRGRTYTRARPLVDWWGYFRPIVLLRLGLKR